MWFNGNKVRKISRTLLEREGHYFNFYLPKLEPSFLSLLLEIECFGSSA